MVLLCTNCRYRVSSNIILNGNISAFWSIYGRHCHAKILTIRCIRPPPQKKTQPPPEKNITPFPTLKDLEHPDKKYNSLGIILIP